MNPDTTGTASPALVGINGGTVFTTIDKLFSKGGASAFICNALIHQDKVTKVQLNAYFSAAANPWKIMLLITDYNYSSMITFHYYRSVITSHGFIAVMKFNDFGALIKTESTGLLSS